jgi:hypothetical protein
MAPRKMKNKVEKANSHGYSTAELSGALSLPAGGLSENNNGLKPAKSIGYELEASNRE